MVEGKEWLELVQGRLFMEQGGIVWLEDGKPMVGGRRTAGIPGQGLEILSV